MPSSNKGSRIVASQARAKAAAKKKAHSSGPDLSGLAAQPASVEALGTDENAELEEGVVAVAATSDDGDQVAAAAPTPVAATPALVRRSRGASRRERQAMTVVAAGSLKWELSLIGSATAAMGVALVVLKVATDIGR